MLFVFPFLISLSMIVPRSAHLAANSSARFLVGLFVFLDVELLDIHPILVISLVNIFSHSVGYLFVVMVVFFAVQTILIRSHLFIFAFISFTLGRQIQKNTAAIYVEECLPIFSSRSFIVSSLTLRSLIHFEL